MITDRRTPFPTRYASRYDRGGYDPVDLDAFNAPSRPPTLLTVIIILGVVLLGMGAAGMVDGLRHPIRAESVR